MKDKFLFLSSFILMLVPGTLSCSPPPLNDSIKNNLEIIIRQDGSEFPPAAWIWISSKNQDNINGWYSDKNKPGFPAISPVNIQVPAEELTIKVWNSQCRPVEKKITIQPNKANKLIIRLKQEINLHKQGYYSFDSHNHLNGYEEKNRPPYIYPYCAALGIDHLDICQGWMFGLRMPVSYDSIINYTKAISNDRLQVRFGSETPKLRYGHTWTINHPGLKEPFNDYLKWHDTAYSRAIKNSNDSIDLRGSLHPSWHPPFVDRIRYREQGGFTVAAHPTRWWYQSDDEQFPATNIAADLAFDLLTIQSYNGLVVMGDHKDNIFYQNLWFHLLNKGYHLVPVAESDGNIYHGSLGADALSYVWTGEDHYHYPSFLQNIKSGHTMLSGKALMILSADEHLPPGSEIEADGNEHNIHVKVYSEPVPDEYVSYLVLYRNGEVKEIIDLRKKKSRFAKHTFTINEKENAWYLVKSYGKVYPENPMQFDVMAYAKECLTKPDLSFEKNTGISMTAPIYFKSKNWQPPQIIHSEINIQFNDVKGLPAEGLAVEIWNVDKKRETVITGPEGYIHIEAPASIDIRYKKPDGSLAQKWLFYEYPPLLDLIEDIYTISWAKKYPCIQGGFMPWEAFHYDEIKEVLRKIDWEITIEE